MSADRKRLLELMLKQRGVALADGPVPLGPDDEKLLSFGQQRLWFLDEMQPGTSAYNVPGAIELIGPLDLDAFKHALDAISARHESLRTTFRAEGAEPRQVIAPPGPVDLQLLDLSDVPAEQRYDRAVELATEIALLPFDLAAGPLWRTALIRLEEDRHFFGTCMHHIVSDGWSLGVFSTELSELYSARVEAREPELPDLPVSYADFAVWQRRWFTGDELERQLAYWKERLQGAPAVLELPTDRPRPPIQSFEGATVGFTLPPELSEAIVKLARAHEVTTFMVTLAAFELLLLRYTGATDVVVGSPIAGRNRSEIEGLIGFFVNNLVLRTDLSGDPTFADVLGRVRDVALGAYAHQDLPFEKLVEELKPPRDLSTSALFQVVFSMQDARAADFHLAGLDVAFPDIKDDSAKVDLSLYMFEGEDEIAGELNYSVALFDRETIEEMVLHFETLLRSIVAQPTARLSEIPILTEAEQQRIVHGFNQTSAAYPEERLIHEHFELLARDTPDAIALSFEDETVTYRELNARANRLAHHLTAAGLGPEDLVGVVLERGIDLLVAVIGVLKSGAAYVPVDPAYPRGRIEFTFRDAAAAAVVTTARLERLVPAGVPRVRIDADGPAIAAQPSEDPQRVTGPTDVAYVIYTSGSTGVPKGVVVEHHGFANLVSVVGRDFDLTADDRVLQFPSIAFDASLFDVANALAGGGTLCLGTRDTLLPGPDLFRFLRDERVTVATLQPSALAALPPGDLPDLRVLMIAGEACPGDLAQQWARDRRVFNGYGPTEATIACTWYEIPYRPDGTLQSLPIGRPIANTQIYILDRNLEPVPVGVPGEVYIAGAGVARGYLRRPGVTAERFLPNPFADEPGARMYRTGDVGRFRRDGNIEFLGRADRQVKVRGFRVELGEIESALAAHPQVREAVVEARGETPSSKRLAAYYVPGNLAPSVTQLRAHLGTNLPDHMIPATFVALDSLPLLPNGKIDRDALPTPEAVRPELETKFEPPRTDTERTLAEIWKSVLGVDEVGVLDNFFDLGGHSLLGTQLMSRIRNRFDAEVPLRALFERPTVGGLAEVLDGYERRDFLPLVRGERPPEALLSFAQQRMWFIDQIDPASATYNVPIALRLSGRVDAERLERVLNAIVERHETLRTTFTTVRGDPRQVVAPEGRVMLSRVDLSYLEAGEREAAAFKLANEEAERPFDLATGPLWRNTLIELAEDDHLFVVCMHHIVSDGWSLGIFAAELSEIYAVLTEGRAPELEPLPIQYADFAAWQRRWFQGAELEKQLAYWKDHLAGAPAALDLPTDYPRPPIQSFDGRSVTFEMPADLSERVRELGRREGVTTFMLGLAAFTTLLHRYTGSTDIVVGAPIAGRNRAEIEGLIGFFVNTLVMRTDLSGDPTFRELMARVRDVALGAYAHQDLPFEKLVEEMKPPRDLSHSPLFQVMFGFQNTPTPEFELTGLEIDLPDLEDTSAKFDLSLDMVETGEGLGGSLNYATSLFDRVTIEEMIDHLAQLLQSVVDDPDARLSELRILTDEERDLVVDRLNQTARDYPSDALMHEHFEAHARQRPDAVALTFEGEHVTYRELNERANKLAHHLRARGLGPERRVGILLDRGVDLVVAVVGVLKSGAAYVPVDPAYPAARVELTFRDAAVEAVVTTGELEDLVPAGIARVRLDSDAPAIAAEPAGDPPPAAAPDDVAYVIYTSGSTGRPKGVMVPHRGFSNMVAAIAQDLMPVPEDRVLQFASVGFDASVFEMAVAVAGGATLCLGSRPDLLPGPDLFRFMSEEGITIANLQPSSLAALPSNDLPQLRALIVAGEVFPGDLAQQWARERRVFNGYGPTEVTIGCSWQEVAYAPAATLQSPPIGAPIANTHVYVLDRNLEPVPVGVPGEMYVAGPGLARGYLDRADLTAERFLPNPFASAPRPGARMYRTGDLGRWRRDGMLEFLGRADRQVKVRGFRIELGEIENALIAHPGIHEVVVDARGESVSDKRLAAYYVSADQAPTVTELRAYLGTTLPDYMIPSAFVPLREIPLTPNGKIDRAALPAPEAARPELGTKFEPPRTDTEKKLVEIWKSVLRLESVGIFDNFFELGGDSILTIQIVARAAEEGIHLTAKQMFQAQTIYDLSLLDEQMSSFKPEQGLVTGPAPLTPIQRWFFEQDPPEPHHFNQAMAIDLDPDLTEEVVREAVGFLLAQHDVLRARYTRNGDQWRQYIGGLPEDLPFERVDLTGLSKEEEAEAFLVHAERIQRSIDLAKGPLLRVAMFDRSPPHVPGLLIVAHHLGIDAVSWPILIEDLGDLCRSIQRRGEAKLPPKSTSFKWWAQKMDEYARSPLLLRELDYWMTVAPWDVEPLPVDQTSGPNDVGSAVTLHRPAGTDLTSALLHEAPAAFGTQIMDVFVAALTLAVQDWKGSPGMLVNLEGHGRNEVLEGANLFATVGWFTTLYPFFNALDPDAGVRVNLEATKAALAAIPNKGFGYGPLRYMTEEGRRLADLPQAGIAFNYFGRIDSAYGEGTFAPTFGETGPPVSPLMKRAHVLEVNASVARSTLQMQWTYSRNRHSAVTVERLAELFEARLGAIVAEARGAS